MPRATFVAHVRFADLTSPQVAALLADARTPVLLLPFGAVEPHGPHAPLATDAIISEAMCSRAAAALASDPDVRALVLPPLPYGVTRFGAGFAGAVGVSPGTLHATVSELAGALLADGFTRLVLVNNHFEPGQVATLRAVTAELSSRGTARVALLDLTRRALAVRLTDEFRRGSCHAGRYETSIVLAEHGELVDVERMRELPALELDMPTAIAAGAADFHALGMTEAYCGAPAEATAAEGEATLAMLAALLIELIREIAR